MPQTQMTNSVVRQVGIVELRAWVRASRKMAERDQMSETARRLGEDEKWLNDLHEAGCYSIVMTPMFLPNLNGVKNG